MRMKLIALTTLALLGAASTPALANRLAIGAFNRDTGISADAGTIQRTWNDLKEMGTTEFVGGTLGSFKLDESSMIAGALTMGATEFDNFLRSGNLSLAASDIGDVLSKNMSKGAGIDLSSVTGSFTSNGGALGSNSFKAASVASSGGANQSDGLCTPETAQKLVDLGNKQVEQMVNAASSQEYGFSKMTDVANSTGNGGFAGLSCLDKLFQNAGSDILFKPPSLGSLTAKLDNWTCGQAVPVAEQIAGAFQGGFDTASLGGFFPEATQGDAMQGLVANVDGKSADVQLFGQKFAEFNVSSEGIRASASLKNLFR